MKIKFDIIQTGGEKCFQKTNCDAKKSEYAKSGISSGCVALRAQQKID